MAGKGNKAVSVRLPPALRATLEGEAESRGLTLPALILERLSGPAPATKVALAKEALASAVAGAAHLGPRLKQAPPRQDPGRAAGAGQAGAGRVSGIEGLQIGPVRSAAGSRLRQPRRDPGRAGR